MLTFEILAKSGTRWKAYPQPIVPKLVRNTLEHFWFSATFTVESPQDFLASKLLVCIDGYSIGVHPFRNVPPNINRGDTITITWDCHIEGAYGHFPDNHTWLINTRDYE